MSAGGPDSQDRIRILYVGSDTSTCQRVKRRLHDQATEFTVTATTEPQQALKESKLSQVDCLVSEYELPGQDGIEFLEAVRATAPDLPFVLYTDAGSEAVASRAISAGVTDYVRKQAADGVEELAACIRSAAKDDTAEGDHQAQLGQFLEAFPNVVFVVSETGRYLDVVSTGDDALLYDAPEKLRGQRFSDILPAETAARFQSVVEDVVKTGEQQRIEYQLKVQSGSRWFESQIIPHKPESETGTVFWLARDITERKRRKQEYEQIFNSVRDAIAVFDPDAGEITEVNDAYREMFGYGFEDIRQLGIDGLSVSEDGYTGQRGWTLIRETARTGEATTVEWRGETSEGDRLWLEATLTPAEINGEQRVLSIQRDITERKRRQRAIKALQAATERLEAATTPERVATIAVETVSEVLGFTEATCWFHDEEAACLEPVAGTDSVSNTDLGSELPADCYEYDVFLEGAVAEYTPSECTRDSLFETGVLLPLGEHGLVAATAQDESRIDEVTLDISKALSDHVTTALDRVERAQAVRESERRFRLIAERIDEVIYLADTDFSEALYVNPAYETIWGRPVEELYDDAKEFIDAIDARDRDTVAADIEGMIQDMQQGQPADSYEFEYRIRRPSGQLRWVSATGYTVDMYDDERRFVGIVKDVTERKRREQRLEVFNRILRHNLRNQLDVIRAHAEAMRTETATGQDHAEQIIAAVDRLTGMGDRARKIDRIMSGEDGRNRISLPDLVEEALGTLTPGPAVDIKKHVPPAVAVTANRDALYTVVKSTLDNAVEHADSEVCVTINHSPQGYDIVVEDDGPGIAEEQLAPIRAGTETSLKHGQGLGLWQLRWGVDVLDGELSFETDDGTTVRIHIPDQAKREG